MLGNIPKTASSVRLQASVVVADPDRPTIFRPLLKNGLLLPAMTGDLVKVEAQANTDGYLTILDLESSGELDVGLPCPTEPHTYFQAGQRCSMVFRLTPPVGTERIVIYWSAKPIQRTALQWRQWIERTGLVPEEASSGYGPGILRGVELMRVKKGPASEGLSRILVIPVTHGFQV
jgi:hypothetical protein